MTSRHAVRLLTLAVLGVLAASLPAVAAAPAPSGRILLSANEEIALFEARSGELRQLVHFGNEPVFLPSSRSFAYIGSAGCQPDGHGRCYTLYTVFVKSLRDRNVKDRGRRIFGFRRFFIRSVDVGRGGRLVFSASPGPGPSAGGREEEIYTSNLGGRVRRLTRNHAFDNDVAVSPDGRHVAFAERVHGRGQIFVMRIDGSNSRRLTHDGRRDRLPSWSPDGRRIIFISQPGAQFGRREIYSIPAHGGRQRRLTHNTGIESDPVYSPDGSWIAYLRSGALWAMRADGATPRKLLRAQGYGGWEGGLDWGPGTR
jgi:hypothetical protein